MNTTDLSGTITTGGQAQTISSLVGRRDFVLVNPHASEDLWVGFNIHTAAPNAAGSIPVKANGGLVSFTGDAPSGPVSVYGATTGHPFTAWER